MTSNRPAMEICQPQAFSHPFFPPVGVTLAMKQTLIAMTTAAMLSLLASGAYAAEEKKATPQQERMKACNKEAGEKKLKGDERKTFMSGCLKGESAAAAPAAAPSDAATACAAKATEKKLAGAAKTSFLKKCEADAAAAK